jgi:vitellogenic carboxypeptidase-like protein
MCNFDIGNDFISDQMKSVKPLFPALLANYKVILFNGNFDFVVPVNGAQMWIDSIKWPGQGAYLASERQIWKVANNVAGFVKEYNVMLLLF